MVFQNTQSVQSLCTLPYQMINLFSKGQVALNDNTKNINGCDTGDTSRGGGNDELLMRGLWKILSFVLLVLCFKLLALAQFDTCSSSSLVVDELKEGTIKYESSAYLSKELPICNTCKFDAQIRHRTNARPLYNAGIDPFLGRYNSPKFGTMYSVIQKFQNPIIIVNLILDRQVGTFGCKSRMTYRPVAKGELVSRAPRWRCSPPLNIRKYKKKKKEKIKKKKKEKKKKRRKKKERRGKIVINENDFLLSYPKSFELDDAIKLNWIKLIESFKLTVEIPSGVNLTPSVFFQFFPKPAGNFLKKIS